MIIEKSPSEPMSPPLSPETESLPPYSPISGSVSSSSSDYLSCVFADKCENGAEVLSVNGIHVSSIFDQIEGTYTIDAKLPARVSPCSKGKGKALAGETLVDGTFRSKKGDIKITLNITNTHIRPQPRKVLVRAKSRKGNISVNLSTLHRAAFLNMDISSGGGDTVFLVPRGFSGIVQIHARKSAVVIDCSLKKGAFVLKATETETLLLVNCLSGGEDVSPAAEPNFCHVETRHGRVLLGMSDS